MLEEAVRRPDSQAFFLAATLLDVLSEHQQATHAGPQELVLADCLPRTTFQNQALSLADIVPPVAKAGTPDWLDNDLRFLLQDPHVPLQKVQLFRSIRGASCLPARDLWDELLVFSDGSTGLATAGPSNCAPGAWAFSVWIRASGNDYLIGHATGTTRLADDPFFLGECDDSPLTCELLGLAWGLAWVVEFAPSFELPVSCHYDCTAAGRGVFAAARLPVEGQAPATSQDGLGAFATFLRQLAAQRVLLSHAHVQGHSGQVGNELCDELAKYCRRQPPTADQVLLPAWPSQAFAHPLKAWLWLIGSTHKDLPTLYAFESEAYRLQSCPALPTTDPCMGFVPAPSPVEPVQLRGNLMSFNVLSLYDPKRAKGTDTGPGMKVVAKRDIIKRQLSHLQVLLLGLQETRLVCTEVLPDADYFMLHSSADPLGHHGTALWVAKHEPYGHSEGKRLYFSKEHLTVTGFSPRHIVVQITAPFLTWTVLVAHGPSGATATPQSIASFWARCRSDLSRRPKGSDLIVLADANAWLGSVTSASVDGLDQEVENIAGEGFHQFLAELDLWAPSTFHACHNGPSYTWVAPSGHRHRLDYIAVPQGWPAEALSSRVQYDFEALQVHPDHYPVLLQVSLQAHVTLPKGSGVFRRKAIRPQAGTSSPQYECLMEQVQDHPDTSWGAQVDKHYAGLVAHWNNAGATLIPHRTVKAQQSYIQPATMALVHNRRGLREFIRTCDQELRRRRLLLGFAAFLHHTRRTSFSMQATGLYAAWIRQARQTIARACSLLHSIGFQVRAAVKEDRAAYLGGLVERVSLADLKDPKHLFRAVRKAFPSAASKRRQSFTSLPAVMDANGEFAGDTHTRRELWRAYFADLESGEKLIPGDYPRLFEAQKQANTAAAPCFDLAVVPTLTSVEQTVLALKKGKACGQDGLTAELLQAHSALSARALLPVFVKSTLSIQEPIEFRGGALMPLAKKATAAFTCSKFRAILLSCVPSKILHRHLRNCLSAHLSPCDLQAGLLPGISTELIALAAKAFQSYCHSSGKAWALLFFDVRSAFYRVVRQLLLPIGDTDKALQALFHELHLPPASLVELREHLERLATVSSTGCSVHLEQVATDALQGTWFRLDQDTALTLTHCGTRPGDSLADLLFGFAFGAYLKSAGNALLASGLATEMPRARRVEPWDLTLPASVGCGSWADDFVHLHAQAAAAGLGCAVQSITAVYVAHADSIGMELTFARDKTAVLLASRHRDKDPSWPGFADASGPQWSTYSCTQSAQWGTAFASSCERLLPPRRHSHRDSNPSARNRIALLSWCKHCTHVGPAPFRFPTGPSADSEMFASVTCALKICFRELDSAV